MLHDRVIYFRHIRQIVPLGTILTSFLILLGPMWLGGCSPDKEVGKKGTSDTDHTDTGLDSSTDTDTGLNGLADTGPSQEDASSDSGPATPDTGDSGGEIPDAAPDAGNDSEADADADTDTGPPPPPIRTGDMTIFKAPHGVIAPVSSVSIDEGGNIWAAGGGRLLLMRAGEESFVSFGPEDGLAETPVLSVAGGEPGEAIVGYEGIFGSDPFQDPPGIRDSGDADRFHLDGNKIRFIEHFGIWSPPSAHYPDGRYVIRTIFRIRYIHEGPFRGDIWFGGNHGTAMYSARRDSVFEHHHIEINLCADGHCTLSTGDHLGLAFDEAGNAWIGGAHGIGRLMYGSEGGNFWANFDPRYMDVWPEGQSIFPAGEDHVHAMEVDEGNRVWVGSLGNGLVLTDSAGTPQRYFGASDGPRDNRVTSMAIDKSGNLYIGTSSMGMARYHIPSASWSYLDATDGLPGDGVWSLYWDPVSGVLVMSTGDAIVLVK